MLGKGRFYKLEMFILFIVIPWRYSLCIIQRVNWYVVDSKDYDKQKSQEFRDFLISDKPLMIH